MPPAARQGDTTVHGGVITVGEPSVLIGGMPAARVSDMHTCPMVTGTVPHVGGPISAGCASVMIGPMLAARVGDMLVCTGPPDTIAMGEMSVLIGDLAGGGGGGAAAATTAAGALGQAEVLRDARRNGDAYCDIDPDVPPSHFSTETLVYDDRPPPGEEQRRDVLTCDLKTLTLKCAHAERGYVLEVGGLDEKGQRLDTLEVTSGPDGDEIEAVTALEKPYCTRHLEQPLILPKGSLEGLAATPSSAKAGFKVEPALSLREQLSRNPFALLWPQFAAKNEYRLLGPTCGLTRSAKVVVYPDLHWKISLGISLDNDNKQNRWAPKSEPKLEVTYGGKPLDYGARLAAYLKTALTAAETAAEIVDKSSVLLKKWAGAELRVLMPNITISGEWGWKEIPGSWKAGYEMKVSAAFSPLVGLGFELDIIATLLSAVGSPLLARLKKLLDEHLSEVGIYLSADGTIGGSFTASRMLGQPKPNYDGSVIGKIEIQLEGRIHAEKKWLFFSVSLDLRAGGRSGLSAEMKPIADRIGFGMKGEAALEEGEFYFHGAASAGFELFQDDSEADSDDKERTFTLWKRRVLGSGKAYFVKNGNANAAT